MSAQYRSSSTIFCNPRIWPSIRRSLLRLADFVSGSTPMAFPRSPAWASQPHIAVMTTGWFFCINSYTPLPYYYTDPGGTQKLMVSRKIAAKCGAGNRGWQDCLQPPFQAGSQHVLSRPAKPPAAQDWLSDE